MLGTTFISNLSASFRFPLAREVVCVLTVCSWSVPGLLMLVVIEDHREIRVFPVAVIALGWVCLAGFPDHRLQAVRH